MTGPRLHSAVTLVATLFMLQAAFPALADSDGPEATGTVTSDTVTIDKLQWARSTDGRDLKWPDAIAYCANLELAGHADWRLPTLAELEALHDPEAEFGIREPFSIETCCLWSGESLADRPAADGETTAGPPNMYHWGFMFDGGHLYYAVHVFEDGQALCVRDLQDAEAGGYQ